MSDEGEREGGNIKKKNQKVTIGNDSLMSYSVSVMMMKSRTGFFIFPSTLASSHIYDNVGGFFFLFFPLLLFSRFTERERQKSIYARLKLLMNCWIVHPCTVYITSPAILLGCAINSDQFPFTFPIVSLTISPNRWNDVVGEFQRPAVSFDCSVSITKLFRPPHLMLRYSE